MHFFLGAFTVLASLALAVKAAIPSAIHASLVTPAQFKEWLANTDANLTFVGAPITERSFTLGLGARQATTMVTYCSTRVDGVCGGSCTVYNGGPACLNAPGTSCLAATNNVAFCANGDCSDCNQLASCGTRLDNNFCFTPSTNSILVGA